ncbi:MAG: alpha/beta fold hydrolase [Hyphomicrobiales bacterium]
MERRLAAILAADMYGFSRLMELDEDAIIARQKTHRSELIDPEVERNHGNLIKSTGDGVLVEFASARDAVKCALEIQNGMVEREAGRPAEERIQYRVGINVGDVVFDDGDIFGDGVNVAARLEAMAEPGGVCISDSVHEMVQNPIASSFGDLGTQRVKNISRTIRVWQWTPDAKAGGPAEPEPDVKQRIQFCFAPDGVQLAFATAGTGDPVFKAPNWLNHTEYEWRDPVWGPFLTEFARHCELIRFDQRGNGLSDWDVEDLSIDTMVTDMEAVASAAKLEKFALFGLSQGCGFSVRYAVENPDRVKCLILLGGYLRGRLMRNSTDEEQLYHAATTMIKQGWGSPNSAFRNFFTSNLVPDATPEQAESFDELQRVSCLPENAVRIWEMNGLVDVTELAGKVDVPTLVLHCEGDRMVPLSEGRFLAARIPGAEFVTLEGNDHLLLPGTPAFDAFFEIVVRFLEKHG